MKYPERADKIKKTSEVEDLKVYLCSFYESGGCPDCMGCEKSEDTLLVCKKDYLSKIIIHPMDIWSEEFEIFRVEERGKTSTESIIGIGINCNTCYMAEKCPLYKSGYECGIHWSDSKPKTIKEYQEFLLQTQYERVSRALIFEKVDGGVPDTNLSGEMDRLARYVFDKIN